MLIGVGRIAKRLLPRRDAAILTDHDEPRGRQFELGETVPRIDSDDAFHQATGMF